jgi:hypothetical protein
MAKHDPAPFLQRLLCRISGFQGRPSPVRRDFTTNGRVFRQSNRAQIVRFSREPVPQSFRQI